MLQNQKRVASYKSVWIQPSKRPNPLNLMPVIQVRVLEIPTTCFDPKPGQVWALNMVYDTIIQMLKPQNEREIGIKKEKKIPKLPTEKVSLGKRGRNQFIANEQELRMLYDQYLKRQISKSEIARRYGISRVTLDKLLKRTGIGAD